MNDRDRDEARPGDGPGEEQPTKEEAPPPYTMKAIGTKAQRLDRAMSDGMSHAVVKMGDKAGGRLRRGMQSGQWQNYVFLIVVALIVIVVLAVVFRR